MESLARFCQGLLLFILCGLVAFGRDFAYLHLDLRGVHVFITELSLAILLPAWIIEECLNAKARRPFTSGLTLPLGLLLAWGGIAYVRGLSLNPILATRKFAILYYALFIPPLLKWFPRWVDIKRMVMCQFTAALVTTLACAWTLFYGPFAKNPYLAMDMAMELTILLCLTFGNHAPKFCGFLVGFQSFLIVFAECRTAWVSLLGGVVVLVFLGYKHLNKPWLLRALACLIIGMSSGLLAFSSRSQLDGFLRRALARPTTTEQFAQILPHNRPIIEVGSRRALARPTTTEQFAQIARHFLQEGTDLVRSFFPRQITSGTKQANVRFRVIVEKEMLRDVMRDHPIIGMGFGIPFISHDWLSFDPDTDIWQYPIPGLDPHNSHLAILYRMGIIGFFLYLLFIADVFRKALRTIRGGRVPKQQNLLLVSLLAYFVLILIHASLGVVLEGPYMGVPFWFTTGLLLQLSSLKPDTVASAPAC